MVRSEARECKMSYTQIIDHYSKNYIREKYINTKYWTPVTHHRNPVLNISGLSGEPIKLSYENLKDKPEFEIAFLILHEHGHMVNSKKGDYQNEKKADKFAIRWTRRLVKEGLLRVPLARRSR